MEIGLQKKKLSSWWADKEFDTLYFVSKTLYVQARAVLSSVFTYSEMDFSELGRLSVYCKSSLVHAAPTKLLGLSAKIYHGRYGN